MILVDTSVWVEHFRGSERAQALTSLLEVDLVLLHPAVLGELALGGLGPHRPAAIADLQRLPQADALADREVLDLILERRLSGRGIGWVDCHLLASALVTPCDLWTFDGRLIETARGLEISAPGDPEPRGER